MNFTTKEECLNDLRENYTKPGHPIAFSGITKIYNYYKKLIPEKVIKDFLASSESYTVHREFKKQQRNPTFSWFKRYQFQIDLVEVRHLSQFNDGVNYLFNCIDTHTRFAYSKPLLNKTSDACLDAFKSIIAESGNPVYVTSDRGSEIVNRKFLSFCEKNNIKLFHNFTSVHASFVERFNRSLKRLVYNFMTENETNRYVDNLQNLVDTYNDRKHRIIGMSPRDAENPVNQRKLSENINKHSSYEYLTYY